VAGFLARKRGSFDILSVKKEANLSGCEMPGEEECNGEDDLQCSSLLTICQRRLGL